MRVAIHIKNKTTEHLSGSEALEKALRDAGVDIVRNWDGQKVVDIVISIGGDGTLLSAVHLIGEKEIPVVGINFGHLGFLTTAGRNDIELLVRSLVDRDYSIEKRTMLDVNVMMKTGYSHYNALNEVYLRRPDSCPLLHTQVELDGNLVATYAADGLIVATPTGSTAYSLSCGGPILAPESGSLVLTPIAVHTLTQRPVILSDGVRMRLKDENPSITYTIGIDSTLLTVGGDSVVEVSKATFCTNLIRIGKQNFFSAIREKLMWGV